MFSVSLLFYSSTNALLLLNISDHYFADLSEIHAFWLIFPSGFLVLYDCLMGKMATMPRSVEALKVGRAISFFLHMIRILMIFCNMQYQHCNKD